MPLSTLFCVSLSLLFFAYLVGHLAIAAAMFATWAAVDEWLSRNPTPEDKPHG